MTSSIALIERFLDTADTLLIGGAMCFSFFRAQGIPTGDSLVEEEGVELALAGAAGDREACIEEAADLIYHMAVLMEARGFGWDDVVSRLAGRHKP